jgi:hypothetical protein
MTQSMRYHTELGRRNITTDKRHKSVGNRASYLHCSMASLKFTGVYTPVLASVAASALTDQESKERAPWQSQILRVF